MKYFIFLFSLVFGFAPTFAQETPGGSKEHFHIYLLIGQSNMAGRASYTEEESKPLTSAYLLNEQDTWEPASNPLNRYSTIRKGLGMQKLNPGYSFALEMLRVKEDNSVGLIVNAKGGTRIEQWAKGTHFYKEAVRRALEAKKTGTLKGILWHQGESDHGNPEGYAEKLQELVENLREDLEIEDLAFVAGQIIGPSPINDEIARLPDLVPNTGVASSEDLKTTDRWHFDTASIKELGRRYAAAMQVLQ